ncbi:3-dehydroquinate synthase II [Microbulbifer thermotolerans]|uniref:3-dehydroquinate synthase II n=1 Tax=Microbulbifer thermotolerans TaxID=252514 RepID=UPI0008F1B648|nr:3-dehydroquinate synthase II [Microbulbifer thermotolerans]SFC38277.1 3-dehydroquinate synthase II [Microbulbifer thermotolerans]
MEQVQSKRPAAEKTSRKNGAAKATPSKRGPTTPLEPAAPANTALFPVTTEVPQSREHLLWYDSRVLATMDEDSSKAIVQRLGQGRYNGIVLYADNIAEMDKAVSPRLQRILHLETLEDWNHFTEKAGAESDGKRVAVISSYEPQVLNAARAAGFRTSLRMHVDNATSLHASFHLGMHFDHLMVSFKDPTNIPLELVIAELHKTNTVLLKEVHQDVDDAVIALGVLELGSDGVLTSFTTMEQFDRFASKMDAQASPRIEIQVGVIDRITHLGLGYRACIDTSHMFNPDEGILVGSTSTGGILCCPEVFHLPYMELRPFRINAASVHSYVFQSNDRTSYISELRAGSQLTTVNARGETRQIYVGRTKTEIRPLLLIEATFPENRKVNIIMQDDWHVRIFSDEAKPLNVTELKPGDRVLGFGTEPGRHVGVKVDEHIIEL